MRWAKSDRVPGRDHDRGEIQWPAAIAAWTVFGCSMLIDLFLRQGGMTNVLFGWTGYVA
jgi:hypothetical protein